MDGLSLTLAFVGAVAGAVGGGILAAFDNAASEFTSLILTFGARSRVEVKSGSAKKYVAFGALIGALTLGSIPTLYEKFTGVAIGQPKPVTLQDCVKSAPKGATNVQLVTQADGTISCSYGPKTGPSLLPQ